MGESEIGSDKVLNPLSAKTGDYLQLLTEHVFDTSKTNKSNKVSGTTSKCVQKH